MSLCRSRLVQSAVCFLCVLVLVFCLIMAPLSVPARAAFVVDDAVLAFVAGTVFLSMGFAYTTNNEALQNLCNGFVQDYAKLGGRVYDLMNDIAERIGVSWDGHGQFAEVNMSRAEYAELTNAVDAWTKLHTSEDGKTITVEVNDIPIILQKENAFQGKPTSLIRDMHIKGLSGISSYFSNSIVFLGNTSSHVEYKVRIMGSNYSYTLLNCSDLGGNGTHVEYRQIVNGSVDGSPCVYCANKSGPAYGFAILCYVDGDYKLSLGTLVPYSSGSYTPDGCSEDCFSVGSVLGIIDDKYFGTSMGTTTGAVDVPVEKDKDYAGGVVAGNWDTLIGKVGSAADSLPFNIPMGGLGGLTPTDVLPKDLTQSGSVDVPDVGEGELNIPAVGDLALPSTISSFFPFCIPFDVIRLIKIFAHDPVIPSFSIPFKIPDIVDYTIQFDFSMFDDVFSFGRLLWDAVFIAGLAAATKKFIKW